MDSETVISGRTPFEFLPADRFGTLEIETLRLSAISKNKMREFCAENGTMNGDKLEELLTMVMQDSVDHCKKMTLYNYNTLANAMRDLYEDCKHREVMNESDYLLQKNETSKKIVGVFVMSALLGAGATKFGSVLRGFFAKMKLKAKNVAQMKTLLMIAVGFLSGTVFGMKYLK